MMQKLEKLLCTTAEARAVIGCGDTAAVWAASKRQDGRAGLDTAR
jgi:hypothetical protein